MEWVKRKILHAQGKIFLKIDFVYNSFLFFFSKMDQKVELSALLQCALKRVAPEGADLPILLERPKNPEHGDFASPVALQLAKLLKEKPQILAQKILDALPRSPLIAEVNVAGAGFINFKLVKEKKWAILASALLEKENFGRAEKGKNQKILLEFVSANPTGPLHVGHGRGAAYGAALANLLKFAGFEVTTEYYVNDAGRQMDILALSLWLRYLELRGVTTIPFPPNAYRGDYVKTMAEHFVAQRSGQYPNRFLCESEDFLRDLPSFPNAERMDEEAKNLREKVLDAYIERAKALLKEEWEVVHQFALDSQLRDCCADLKEFGVGFDVWFSEKILFTEGWVAEAVQLLEEKGHIYTQNGAKWFRSSFFGDEKDRVVQRDNGQYTYFASDIAYHLNKYRRGFQRLINIWGADHHGYIARVKGAIEALGENSRKLEIALVQFAVLYRNGQKVSMSTRSGDFVTLRQLRNEVGNDACRFFYSSRKADQHLDFDLDLAKKESSENPVYYVQYAHARIDSLFKQWGGDEKQLENARWELLSEDEKALQLMDCVARFPETIESAAQDLAVHKIAFYARELAGFFHAWYNAERIIVPNEGESLAKLALCRVLKQVIQNALGILGVSAPDRMDREKG